MLIPFLKLFSVALVFAVILMVVIWRLALRMRNLGIVDIAWSLSFAPIALFFAIVAPGDPAHRWLMAGLVVVWSVRLGLHLYFRVMSHHPHEDVRYAELRAKWGPNRPGQALLFFQFQAALIALLSTLFLVVCFNEHSNLSLLEWSGLVVWLIAVAGEGLADRQLEQFKRDPKNKGHVCQAGLWNYSRHPNYFFEWLVWVGFFLFAYDSPHGCFTVLCPGLMLFFLLRVTGIPMTEKLSVKSKGDEYREYQKTTSAFVPWFKKGSGSK